MTDSNTILEVLAHEAALDPITLTAATELRSLNITSLDMMNVLFSLEDRLGVILDFEDLEKAKTIGDLVASVEARLAAMPVKAQT